MTKEKNTVRELINIIEEMDKRIVKLEAEKITLENKIGSIEDNTVTLEQEIQALGEKMKRDKSHSMKNTEEKKKEEPEDIKCKECGKFFVDLRTLSAHKNKEHADMVGKKEKATEIMSKVKREIKCNLCIEKFNNGSSLELHVKRMHKGYPSFDCKICKKNFVTKWRLKKHSTMHTDIKVDQCHYFKSNKCCPYDYLGCKFRHTKVEDTASQSKEISETKKITALDNDNLFDSIEDMTYEKNNDTDEGELKEDIRENSNYITNDTENSRQFLSSTPKKHFPCEDCEKGFECTDCIVMHMLGMHDIAKVTFKSWQSEPDNP